MATQATSTLSTSHGTLSYTTSTPPDARTSLSTPFIVLIHGNSSSSTIFHPILSSSFSNTYPILTVDLPGHGKSSNAPNPTSTYTMPGYAKAIAELLSALQLPQVMILGWSLGGHIAMELLALPQAQVHSKILGIMIVGTPPVGPGEVSKGFYLTRDSTSKKNYASTADLTKEELDTFAEGMTFRFEPWLRDAVVRTDPIARENMWNALERMEWGNQRDIVREINVLTAVVNGQDEPFVDLGWVRSLEYGRLWEGKCHEIPRLGHAPFFEDWSQFEGIMERWAKDCEAEGK